MTTLRFPLTTARRIRARTTECASAMQKRKRLFVSALRDTKVIGAREKLTTARHQPGVEVMAHVKISLAPLLVLSVIVIMGILASFVNNRSIFARRTSAVTTAFALVNLLATSVIVILDMKENSVRRRKTIALPIRV